MNRKALRKIKKFLEEIFKVLKDADMWDNRLRDRYAEYYVAFELAKRGYKVDILNKRKDARADICIRGKNKDVLIEVKSGKCGEDNMACASFHTGNQVKKKKFDYCVFIVFNKKWEGDIKKIFVFTRDELAELAKPRKGIAAHIDTNPCILLYALKLKTYCDYMKKYKSQMFKIEQDLIKNPKKYSKRWGKIRL